MMRFLVFCLIVYLMVCSSVLAVNGNMGNHDGYVPDGSEASPWLIEDLADFDAFASSANAGLYWGAGGHIKLVCDLDLSGRTYKGSVVSPALFFGYSGYTGHPFGDYAPVFAAPFFNGIFDGNYHSIYYLKIDCRAVDVNFLGLFGYLGPNAVVQKVSLQRLNILDDNMSNHAVGGLVGYNCGMVYQCMTAGKITGIEGIGGVCGINYGTISQCCSDSEIVCEWVAGGLCAYNNGKVINSYANGSVTSDYDSGGFIGVAQISSYVRNCYSLCSMPGYSKACFCAINLGVVINSYFNRKYSPVSNCGGYYIVDLTFPEFIIGWNEGIWKFDHDNWDDETLEVYYYPILNWQSSTGEFITTDYPARQYSGSGTQTDPFVLWNVDDFANLAEREPDWDKYFVLKDDIWLDGSFKSIADFSGTFDGQGHTIYDLDLKPLDDNKGNYGLFGRVTGTVKNVNLENVTANGVVISGAICSNLYGGTISNCTVEGDMKTGFYSGGICAVSLNGRIENCHFNGTIDGYWRTGGLCSVMSNCTVTDSHVKADITGRYDIIGGLTAVAYQSNIERCYTDCDILINDPDYSSSLGGMFSGISHSTISNCSSTGSIRRQMTASRTEVAGSGFAEGINGSTITNCYTDCYSYYPGFDIYYYNPPYISDQTSDITGCFWNSDKVQGSDYYVSGTGITTGQFSDKSIFAAAGWDFTYNKADGTADIWYMSDRPALSWAKQEVMDMEELGLLATSWLCNDCVETDNCSYVDYYPDGVIDLEDLLTLAQNWLHKPDEKYCD